MSALAYTRQQREHMVTAEGGGIGGPVTLRVSDRPDLFMLGRDAEYLIVDLCAALGRPAPAWTEAE